MKVPSSKIKNFNYNETTIFGGARPLKVPSLKIKASTFKRTQSSKYYNVPRPVKARSLRITALTFKKTLIFQSLPMERG